MLVDLGADIEVKTNYGFTSLLYASRYGHIDIVKLLIDSGPSCMAAPAVRPGADIEAKDNSGWTPLLSASCNGHIDIVKLLIDLGADIEAKNKYGKKPKQVAFNTNIKIVIECCEYVTQLKEWRPWNHSKYSSKYRNTMKILVLLAKQLKND